MAFEERASDKQLNFMKKLGVNIPQNCTKHQAKDLIEQHINKEALGYAKPQNPYVQDKPQPVTKVQDKEYHLTPEECRARALECALKWYEMQKALDKEYKEDLINVAMGYEDFITGKLNSMDYTKG